MTACVKWSFYLMKTFKFWLYFLRAHHLHGSLTYLFLTLKELYFFYSIISKQIYLVNNSCCSLLNKQSAFWERLSSFKNCIWSNKPNYIIIKYVINVNKYQMGCKIFNFRSVQIDWDKHCCGILSVTSKAQKGFPLGVRILEGSTFMLVFLLF